MPRYIQYAFLAQITAVSPWSKLLPLQDTAIGNSADQEAGKAEIMDVEQVSMSRDAATSTCKPAEPNSFPKGTLCFLALFHAVLFADLENPKHCLKIFSFQKDL